MLIRPGRLFGKGTILSSVAKVLRLANLGYLSPNITHMFYPNEPSRSAGNRHYLYVGGAWTATGTTMTGTMDSGGVVTGGTFSFSVPVATVETFTLSWDVSGVVWTCFSIGFNRILTEAERTALGASGFKSSLFAGSSVSGSYQNDITGRTYFVDFVNGNDSNTGLAPGVGNAWKTASKANGFSFKAGDGVRFKGGSTYGQVSPSVSGTAAQPIVWGAYGVSAGVSPPIFAGSGSGSFIISGRSGLLFVGLRSRFGTNTSHVTATSAASNITFWLAHLRVA